MAGLVVMGFLMAIVGVGGILVSLSESDETLIKWYVRLGLIFLCVGVVTFAFGLGSMQDKITKLEDSLKTPKTYYYDGFKIDVEDVDLREFVITYDPEKDIYTLTRKEN